MLQEISTRVDPNATLAVLPDGVMLNYLSRRANPTPYIVLVPTEVAYFGEDRILAAYEAHPPDYIVLVHKDTSEYGVQFFGRDYAQRIAAWIRAHYQAAVLIGAPPLHDDRFGLLLLKRAAPSAQNFGEATTQIYAHHDGGITFAQHASAARRTVPTHRR